MLGYKDRERLPKRKSPRLKGYDYSTQNYYFVTVCTHQKRCIFGTPQKRNRFGEIAENGLCMIAEHFSGVSVDNYVVMPNHIHAIIVFENAEVTLPVVVGQYKAFVTKRIHQQSSFETVWQKSFHDHIIRNQKSYERIWEYIETNPNKWEEDCFYTE